MRIINSDNLTSTEIFSTYAADLEYRDISSAAADIAKKMLLDTIGNFAASAKFGEGCNELVSYVLDQDNKPEARIFPLGLKVSQINASFIYGCLAHALDFDDVMDGPPGHVALGVVPVAMALAENLDGEKKITGEEMLTAMVLGSEIICRLGKSIKVEVNEKNSLPRFLIPQVLSYFGATAVAGKLIGLSAKQFQSAFGIALMQTAGTFQPVYTPFSVGKNIYGAFPSQVGLQSALMASKGIEASADVFGGEAGLFNAQFRIDTDLIVGDLGEKFYSEERWFKLWPSSSKIHPFIEAALELTKQRSMSEEDIKEVIVYVGKWGRAFCEPVDIKKHPSTSAAAKTSIPFAVAKILINKELSVPDFLGEGLRDKKVGKLTEKITYRYLEELDEISEDPPGQVEIKLHSGKKLNAIVEHPMGHPNRPLSWDSITKKFIKLTDLAAFDYPENGIKECVSIVENLENVEDAREILDTLFIPNNNYNIKGEPNGLL